jgi:hypothetical protein
LAFSLAISLPFLLRVAADGGNGAMTKLACNTMSRLIVIAAYRKCINYRTGAASFFFPYFLFTLRQGVGDLVPQIFFRPLSERNTIMLTISVIERRN